MKKTKFLVAAAVIGICAALVPAQVKRTVTKTDRFPFGAGGTVTITGAPAGSIHIKGGSTDEIEITATVELTAPSDADIAKLAEVTGFVTDESLSKVRIISIGTHSKDVLKKAGKKLSKNLIGIPFRIDYVVTVPHYCDLEIDGGVGDLSVENVQGSMFVNFLETKATLTLFSGTANITIQKGSVDAAFGTRLWSGRSASIQIGTGDISVHLPSTQSANIDAIVLRTGKIENEFPDLKPRDRKIVFSDKSMLAKAGVGGPPIKLGVGDGTIKIGVLGK
jgi:DUF4097 and DUF4098 domain-containing protein YvlB